MTESERGEMCLTVVTVASTITTQTTPASAEKMKRVSILGSVCLDKRPDAPLVCGVSGIGCAGLGPAILLGSPTCVEHATAVPDVWRAVAAAWRVMSEGRHKGGRFARASEVSRCNRPYLLSAGQIDRILRGAASNLDQP